MASKPDDNQLPQLLQGIDSVPGLRQAIMLLAMAASVALGVTAVLWMQRPMHTALPPMPNMGEAQQMLKAAGIDVADEGDRLTVPVDDYARAKNMLVEGLVLSGDHRDCSAIPGSGSMSQSLSVEEQALNCHLEVELARTLNNLYGVNNAVVHISSPDKSVFVRPRMDTTAAITVGLSPDRQADRELARSIVHLVANAVPLLMPENVTVVANGRMISDQVNGDAAMDMSNKQTRFQRALESEKEDHIREMLSRTLGAEHYTVTVSSEIDFTQIDRTERRPTEAVVIGTREQFTESPNGQPQPTGVPGGLTNSPIPTNNEVEADGNGGDGADATAAANAGRGLASRSVTTNREPGEIYEVIRQPIGTLKRLTISVMLDQLTPRPAPESENTASDAPADAGDDAAAAAPVSQARFSPEEIASIEALIRDAVTFDEARGDSLTIKELPFKPMTYEEPIPAPWWQSPLIIDLARQALGALFVVALFFTTIRPMITKLMTAPPQVAVAAAGAYGQAAIGAEGADVDEAAAPARIDHQAQITEARDFAQKHPDRTAKIVEAWVEG
ncbi:MAG: flagellar basal-body MS-ring/collar protein FliF [Pseudomonadota bacterium]